MDPPAVAFLFMGSDGKDSGRELTAMEWLSPRRRELNRILLSAIYTVCECGHNI